MSGPSPRGAEWGAGKGTGTEPGGQSPNPGSGAHRLWVEHQDRSEKCDFVKELTVKYITAGPRGAEEGLERGEEKDGG